MAASDAKAESERREELDKLEAVSSLARGIAHQFNNLLMVVVGLSELVCEELPEDSPHRADLEEILEAGMKGATLTQQLLAFARSDMARAENLDLNTVLASTKDLLKGRLGDGVQVRYELGPGLERIHVDPNHLKRVLINLAQNAADAMPDGGTLAISTASTAEGVELRVADDGHGMTAGVLERCFVPFFSTRDPGRGLGLSTAYGIVMQAGGEIHIESRPQEGTAVFVRLPRSTEASSPDLCRSTAVLPTDATALLAEDEEAVRRLTSRVLESGGFRVLEARDGQQALDLAEEGGYRIDLLVTDSVMPGMSGSTLAARLMEKIADLPVIVMSGYTETPTASALTQLPNVSFLRKPVTREKLLGTIATYFK